MTKHKAEEDLEFQCLMCSKRFEKAHNLNVHMSMVHPLTQADGQRGGGGQPQYADLHTITLSGELVQQDGDRWQQGARRRGTKAASLPCGSTQLQQNSKGSFICDISMSGPPNRLSFQILSVGNFLTIKNNSWRIILLPETEDTFQRSWSYKRFYVWRHMKEAQQKNDKAGKSVIVTLNWNHQHQNKAKHKLKEVKEHVFQVARHNKQKTQKSFCHPTT